jgi:hypothetical protein
MNKIIGILTSIFLISLISFGHWLVFYEFPNFHQWTIWYLSFIFFAIPILIINKVFIELLNVFRCLLVFVLLIIGQSISDLILIKYYYGGNISEVYYFFFCMKDSWIGNVLLSCIPLFIKTQKVDIISKENSEVIDDISW